MRTEHTDRLILHLRMFAPELRSLKDLMDPLQYDQPTTDLPFVLIGGMWALRLHGLETREPEDLDIIVYSPNSKTREYLMSLSRVDPDKDDDYRPTKWEKIEGQPRRSFKVIRDELTLNIVVDHYNTIDPRELLFTPIFGGLFSFTVQSIDRVLAAKRWYNRDKDRDDLQQLANQNFL